MPQQAMARDGKQRGGKIWPEKRKEVQYGEKDMAGKVSTARKIWREKFSTTRKIWRETYGGKDI
jgi:hypothetical protein